VNQLADDKDKQKYSYRPNIEYQDTYESDHQERHHQTVYTSNKPREEFSQDITDSIDRTFNDLSKIIPMFPVELQTSINNVYKPILDDWSNIREFPYPVIIPDPDKEIYIPKDGDETQNPPGPFLYPQAPDLPTQTDYDIPEDGYIVNNDTLWETDPPLRVEFDTPSIEDIIEREYIKNIADLYNFYTNKLKDILYRYYSERLMAMFAKKQSESGNSSSKTKDDVKFLFEPIKDNCSSVEANSKHLFDASLAMGEKASLKMCFLSNAFPVEQTLFHLKNFKTVYLLRLRYAKIDISEGTDKVAALNNNILKGMKISYDQKYDVAFTNLYKYLNSSLDILEDAINTELAGLKSRRTLIEKGGISR
jgi:hypothetical protein